MKLVETIRDRVDRLTGLLIVSIVAFVGYEYFREPTPLEQELTETYGSPSEFVEPYDLFGIIPHEIAYSIGVVGLLFFTYVFLWDRYHFGRWPFGEE